ncbi:MAG: hypothetical protein EZS28_006113 [Streblomastix strix]|uniref:Uncharacterized protein n=1 Tax=Streblomastix strix TaxID=222440 RepID=A0A5J4WTX4_9EUKA|nr:MAG: hypothetical protein EZS28_006113 [Streblomastix strix]
MDCKTLNTQLLRDLSDPESVGSSGGLHQQIGIQTIVNLNRQHNSLLFDSKNQSDVLSLKINRCNSANGRGKLVGPDGQTYRRQDELRSGRAFETVISRGLCDQEGNTVINLTFPKLKNWTSGSFNVSAATASMENQIYDGISNRQFILQYPNENYIIRECTFTNCFATGNGGALSIKVSNGASINIIDCTFTNCTSVANGGAIKLDISAGSTSTFEGLIQFINCSGLVGGAFWASIGSENSKLIINQMQIQDCSSSNIGGGMYLQSKLQAIVNIEQLTFKNCSSLSSGGGAYIITESQGYITINKITAEDCTCQKGNGGGIYVNIDFGASSQFKMINISLLRCKAQSDTSNDIPPTGYGGGIFLSGQGNYDSLTKVLDFRKMKFNGNTADKAGQTMYVAISKVVEWCKEGTLGEYVKGNYSDGTSSQNELQGIPDDLQTFNYYSSTQINELQNRLQYYWNVDRDEYYVRSNGSDQQPCNSSNPCLTVEESQINLNINSLKPFLLYIYDSTSISNNVIISQFHTPRTFRNYPLDSIQLSTILIQATGGFYVSGKVRFQLINFIMEGTQQYGTHGISGLSDASEIDIKDCQFHMQNAGSQIGKCLVYASIGGNHAISNLIAKDISSYENIIKILFYYAGSVIITDCQFENITKIGETIAGGATLAILQSHQNRFDIIDCKFTSCKAPYTTGGAVYAEIVSASALIAITRTIFKQCEALNGGGLYSRIHIQGNVIIDHSCEFKQCKAIQGNGGGIYSEIYPQESTYISFHINDALIQDCQALTSSNPESTGYGGGIFIGVEGNYNPSTQKLNLKGMKIYGNSASKAGQSLYAVMSELKDWCEYGLFGVNVKGNFSEIDSNQNDLQGLPIDFSQFASIEQSYIQTNQKTLLNYWVLQLPTNQIWHITQRDSDTSLGNDIRSCGEVSLPCKTIEYTIQEISLNKGGLPTVFIEEKNIGIRLNGYDLMDPLQLSKSGSYSNVIKIMKQMYGTSSEIPENSEIKIVKNNDNNKENGKVGWISVFEGLQLHLYGLNIIMDNSQLTIPIIYVQDSDSLLDLISIGFSRIILSPMTEAKGIIHINVDNSQFNALYCSFKNIDISSKGGNAIRILNSGSYPIKATIKGCQFNSINSIGDSNGRGGSAIYMESKHGSKLIIDESCQFQKCLIDNGNGGAIYISIDFTSQFEFKINNALIQECEAKADTIQTSPTGYGGGIFLTGSGDYYPSTQRLDLKGMKIFNNIADKGGQSLYVAMTKIKDWCQTGILGEYVKGNYNDKINPTAIIYTLILLD